MSRLESLRQALVALRSSKLRSALTMLGVIIGVSAMMTMVGVVSGFQSLVRRQFEGLGSRLIIIGYQPERPREARRRFDGLRLEDERALREQCDLVVNLAAENDLGSVNITAGSRERSTRVIGVEPTYQQLHAVRAAQGRFIDREDLEGWNAVCVLGPKAASALFGAADPIGREVTVSGVRLGVVGLLEKKGRSFDEDFDDRLYLPLTTVQKRMTGSDRISILFAQARDPEATEAAMDQVWAALMRRHDNRPDFVVESESRILATFNAIMLGLGSVLAGIAGLSLLVGGIGIMNIMLVSITERTREIGIRKAVGAKRRDILWQFLIEAMTLSGIGGMVGVGFGCGTVALVAAVAGERLPAFVPPWAGAIGFGFSLAVGIVSGVYPAFRASRLDPIAALRHE